MQAATVVINRRALRHNLQRLRELAPASKMVAVVKANVYGHGLLETARTFPDAGVFDTARLKEALRLRTGKVTKPVLLLEGFFDARDLPTIPAQYFRTAAYNEEQLAALGEANLDGPVTVWMKLDTDVYRLDVRPGQAEVFYHHLIQCKNVRQPVNIVNHFARVDEPKCDATGKQLVIFNTFCEDKSGQRSIAASGGILFWSQPYFDWVCPGIILYGISPLEDRSTGTDSGYRSMTSLTSSLIAVHECETGEPIGYGETWASEHDTRLDVVAMDHGDGYPRAAPPGTPVLVNGREVPIVGRMAVDTICADLGPQAQDKARDPVISWGEGLPVECTAEMTKISTYELITHPTSGAAMKYVG